MSWFAFVDNYCERTGVGLLGEPLNALTNLSFFIAAWLLWRAYHASGTRDKETQSLIAGVALVGLGSLTFHTFANFLAMWADVIPIVMFVCYYLWVALRRLLAWSNIKAFFALVVFLVVAVQLEGVPPPSNFNGSIAYFPCLAVILLIGLKLYHVKHPAWGAFLKAAALFTISLTLRSLDMAACETLPIGTHFLWHLMNGAVLYILTRAILDHRPAN